MKVEDFLNINTINNNIENKYTIKKTKILDDGVILYLDSNEKVYLSIDSYFGLGISKLKGLDESLYLAIKNDERVFLAYRGVLRKLSIKDYSIKQIRDYLINKKQLSNEETKQIIDKLIDYGMLDDSKYCVNRISYLSKQLFSNKQIRCKLLQDGINKDLINTYLIENASKEYTKVCKLASKYSKSIKGKSLNALKQTILTKIVNAGYKYDLAIQAINELDLCIDNELQLLQKEYLKAKQKYQKKYENYDLRNHIYSYLVNKGFKSEDIKKTMEE